MCTSNATAMYGAVKLSVMPALLLSQCHGLTCWLAARTTQLLAHSCAPLQWDGEWNVKK